MKTKQQLLHYMSTHLHMTDGAIKHNLQRQKLTNDAVASLRAEVIKQRTAGGLVTPHSGSKPITQLLEQFDDVAKVRARMKQLPKDQFLEDEELRRELKLSITRWREVRAHTSLAAYLFKLPNNRYAWMHPKAQEELTSAINLNGQ